MIANAPSRSLAAVMCEIPFLYMIWHVSLVIFGDMIKAYLRTTKLDVTSVDLLTEDLIDGGSTSEDDRLTLDLDNTLTQSNEISTDTDGSSSDHRDGENIVVSPRSFTSNQTGST